MLQNNQISKLEFTKGCALMIGRAVCPNNLKQLIYLKLLRK
jgi:hypothetical protein